MDPRLSHSMPMLGHTLYFSPVTYRAISPRWPERRLRSRRDFYVAGVRTQLIGWDSYPNPNRSPKRLILCGGTGSYQKMTRSSSTAELSRAGVYCSTEDLRDKKGPRRATSCEDVYRATTTTTTGWDSRLSESGVSLNDSHTDLGSCVGLEDVDGVSQYSFGSSSAFHEITCDSEMDRPDSDCVSVPSSGYGHDRSRDNIGYDRHRDRGGGGGHQKSRHDSGSREKFLSELAASSGRSSPTEDKKEFYHSTPTKRGSPILSIFPGDEEDLHFPSNLPKDSLPQSLDQSSKDSLLDSPNRTSSDSHLFSPIHTRDSTSQLPSDSLPSSPGSPRNRDGKKTEHTSDESIVSSTDALREALRRKRNQFFAAFQDCSSLEEQSAGESVQSWLTTGHTQRHHAILTDPASVISDQDTSYHPHQLQPPHQGLPQSPSSSEAGSRIRVRDMVRAIERGPSTQMGGTGGSEEPVQTASDLQAGSGGGDGGGGGETGRYGATTSWQCVGEGGGADRGFSPHLCPSAANETVSLLTTVTGPAAPGSGRFDGDSEHNKLSSPDGDCSKLYPVSDEYNELFSAHGKTPTSVFTNLREEEQQSENKASHTSGTFTGRNEEDGPYLQDINYGRVTSADQLSDTNYRAVSDNDKLADASANTPTTTTTTATAPPLHSANALLPGQSSTSDVYRSETSFVGGKEEGREAVGERYSTATNVSSLTGQRSDYDGQHVDSEGVDQQLLSAVSCDWNQDEKEATDMDQSTDSSADALAIREVNQRHTRHVHRTRTTVEETVTTRHTAVRHSAGSPTSALGEGDTTHRDDTTTSHGLPNGREYELIDKTVSKTTVREEDSEREETTTRNISRQPLSQSEAGGARGKSEYHYTSRSDYAPGDSSKSNDTSTFLQTGGAYNGDSKYSSSLSRLTSTPRQKENTRTIADIENNFDILANLEEQLSLLSSSFEDGIQSPTESGPVFEYTDYAEASLPETQQNGVDGAPNSNNLVRGTGSVFFTLDRNGSQDTAQLSGTSVSGSNRRGNNATDWKTDGLSGLGSPTAETRQDTSLHHARADQIVTGGEKGTFSSRYGEGRDDDISSHRFSNSLWHHPASSSEVEDSDDRYTSISTTTSSHQQPYSDSDTPSCEGRAEDNVHTFHDFLSGLKSHSVSDQPSLHRSVDMIVEDFPSGLFHSCVQDTILEADDESETADEDNVYNPYIHSFKTSLHFSVPHSTPRQVLSVSPVPQIRVQDIDQGGVNMLASDDRTSMASRTCPPQVNDRLSDISELRAVHSSHSPELSVSRNSAHGSPTTSNAFDRSHYSTSASAEVQKITELGTPYKLAESTPTHKMSSRNFSSALKRPKKSQWVQEKLLLFQKLLNDFDSQNKTLEQKLLDEMIAREPGRGGRDDGVYSTKSEVCDDLYRSFTREFLEQRQNHTCPIIEDHMPAFRFKRFLRKKHNSKLKGHKTFRIRHQLDKLMETSQSKDSDVRSASDVMSVTDVSLIPTTGLSPYHLHPPSRILSPHKLRGRMVSDVFTDDADVRKSFSSDSAYSSLSSSRHISDLDSTFRSVASSRGDVSSIATDVSMEEDKLRSLSDVFDHLDMCEGDIDQARLDRLRVGHYKAETL